MTLDDLDRKISENIAWGFHSMTVVRLQCFHDFFNTHPRLLPETFHNDWYFALMTSFDPHDNDLDGEDQDTE